MPQISQFLRKVDSGLAHWCPACLEMHLFSYNHWTWDGHIVEPTFLPAMRITVPNIKKNRPPAFCCHYSLIQGKLEFYDDCTHSFRGVKMTLPPLPAFMRDRCLNF